MKQILSAYLYSPKTETKCVTVSKNKAIDVWRLSDKKKTIDYKWLGQIIFSLGLAASVSRTVASKETKIKGACLEIAVIVNDWRA